MNRDFIFKLIEIAEENNASDIHLKVDNYPLLRIVGEIQPLKEMNILSNDDLKSMVNDIVPEGKWEELKKKGHADFAIEAPGGKRCRVNVFSQRGSYSISMRLIPNVIKSFEELHLPDTVRKLAEESRGIILVTGITGSGKSTTLAAMIDYINEKRKAHIITIEDPIEFIHRDKNSIINQREVGSDVPSFAEGLRSALRQDPDVILIGEMRDLETIETALIAAETGHLVLSTLHTLDVVETVNRIVSVFPPYQQDNVRYQLAGVLKGVISQRLVKTKDGKGRVPAVEILVSTARVRECIIDKTKTTELLDTIEKGRETYGTQSFDQSLLDLIEKGLITYEEALKHCRNEVDFSLKYKGLSKASGEDFWE